MRLIDAEALKEMLCVRCMEYAECHKTGSELPVVCPWKKAIDEAPAVNALTYETIKDALSQIRWERDTALDQLAELGYELGEKVDADVRRVVLCKDCKWSHHDLDSEDNLVFMCEMWDEYPMANEDGYCHKGRRKEVQE